MNLNCVLHCPCGENWFEQSNVSGLASEIPKYFPKSLLFCFPTKDYVAVGGTMASRLVEKDRLQN